MNNRTCLLLPPDNDSIAFADESFNTHCYLCSMLSGFYYADETAEWRLFMKGRSVILPFVLELHPLYTCMGTSNHTAHGKIVPKV